MGRIVSAVATPIIKWDHTKFTETSKKKQPGLTPVYPGSIIGRNATGISPDVTIR